MKCTKPISLAALVTTVFALSLSGIALAEPITDLTPVQKVTEVEKVPIRVEPETPSDAVVTPSGPASTPSPLDTKSLNNALFLLQIQQELKSAYQDYHKLNRVIDGSQERVNGLKEKLGGLRDEILHFQKEIDESEARIKNVGTLIGLQSKEIGLLEEEILSRGIALEEQKVLLADYMRMIYVNENRFAEGDGSSELSPAKLLLSGEDLGEMIQQMTTLDMLQHNGQVMLEKLRGSQDAIAGIQRDVAEKKKALDAMKDKLLAQRERLEDEKLTKERLLQVTHGEDQTYKKLIAQSVTQQEESLLEINSLQSNFNYVKDNLSKLGNSVSASDIAKLLDDRTRQMYEFHQQADQDSVLQWPVAPTRGISAYFRDSAYLARFGVAHQAIDIPTLQGTAIHAPKDGIVYKVKDNGMGYSYIILSHKGQLMTVYGHVSSILVKEGQAVMTGSVLGLTGGMPGTKGAGYLTTGAHLHFEVFAAGKHVDPLDYLSLSKLSLDDLPAKYAKRVESEGVKRVGASSGVDDDESRAEEDNHDETKEREMEREIGVEIQKSVEQSGEKEIETYKTIFGE